MTDVPTPAIEFRVAATAHNTAVLGDVVTSGREKGPNIAIEASNGLIFADLNINTQGNTSFAAAGIELKFGDQFFWRPGLGLAVHNGKIDGGRDDLKFGSRLLIYARWDFGIQFDDMSVALRLEHLSNGGGPRINNGLDNWGVVVSKKF
jgi:hypothetical protein